jgi:hypothetical protein
MNRLLASRLGSQPPQSNRSRMSGADIEAISTLHKAPVASAATSINRAFVPESPATLLTGCVRELGCNPKDPRSRG